jgi:hypothetical protein
MRVKVISGYVSYNRRLFGLGEFVDIPDDVAKRFVMAGIVELASGDTAPEVETAPKAEPVKDIALPDVDPAANVKPKRKARAKA